MGTRQIALLVLLAAIWGASFIFIRVAVKPFGPLVLADGRVAIAAATLLLYAAATRSLPGLRGRWRRYIVLGAVNAAAPFALISAAELRIDASLAAIINATAPLFAAVVASLWLGEPLARRAAVGLVLGLAGVAMVVGLSPQRVDTTFVLAVCASLAAAFGYGLGSNYARHAFTPEEPPLTLALGQLLAASALLLPLIGAVPPRAGPSATEALALAALAIAGTALAYLLYFRLLAEVGATRALTVTFLVPVFGVLWAALFLGEAVTLGTLAGGLAILASVALVTGWRPGPPAGVAQALRR